MKVLHLYPKDDDMVTRHVNILVRGMQDSIELKRACSPIEARKYIREWIPDIVHCHGCWTYWIVKAGNNARKQSARIVLSPHGQLEPWVINERPMHEKLQKNVIWQKRFSEKAYTVISFGKMEEKFLKELKWNPRIEVIKNSVITNSISQKEMCSQTFSVYQKVLDSNVLELMDEETRQLMAIIIKAGIMGDNRWVDTKDIDTNSIDWRKMLIYAEHQNIRNYVNYGINILGLNIPLIDTEKIDSYFPEKYTKPHTIKELIGDYKGNETDYLIRMIRQIQKSPLLLHLIELTRELYRDNINDTSIIEVLNERKLTKYASRLMQVLREVTLLDEGYMPLEPTDDRGTQQIRNIIANNLNI